MRESSQVMDYYFPTLLTFSYTNKARRHEQDWFLSPVTTELWMVWREGAATVVIPHLCVAYPRLPLSVCLHSEIVYWGRDLNASILATAECQQALKLSACPSSLSSLTNPFYLFRLFPFSTSWFWAKYDDVSPLLLSVLKCGQNIPYTTAAILCLWHNLKPESSQKWSVTVHQSRIFTYSTQKLIKTKIRKINTGTQISVN